MVESQTIMVPNAIITRSSEMTMGMGRLRSGDGIDNSINFNNQQGKSSSSGNNNNISCFFERSSSYNKPLPFQLDGASQ